MPSLNGKILPPHASEKRLVPIDGGSSAIRSERDKHQQTAKGATGKVKMLDLNYYTVEMGPHGNNLAQKTFKATHAGSDTRAG